MSRVRRPTVDDTAKLRVGILGATGMVGQRFIQLLDGHPQFIVTALAASDRSQGKPYAQACTWRLAGEMPKAVRAKRVSAPEPPLDCDVIFSSLPGEVARDVEAAFAKAGYPVISNSSAFRMDAGVPLLIPEVNADHLKMLDACGDGGFVVTNPNCATVVVTMALAPLKVYGIEAVAATTMQGLSGAGYPGVSALDITDNVIPYIASEEEKIERETRKLLGDVKKGRVADASFAVSAQCHRVNVLDGHLVAMRVRLAKPVEPRELAEAFASFTALPQELGLPSAPDNPIIVRPEPDRPQPRLDRNAGNGMSITVGRIARDQVFTHKFVALGHNTIRGAAGATILNAELMLAQGRLERRRG